MRKIKGVRDYTSTISNIIFEAYFDGLSNCDLSILIGYIIICEIMRYFFEKFSFHELLKLLSIFNIFYYSIL